MRKMKRSFMIENYPLWKIVNDVEAQRRRSIGLNLDYVDKDADALYELGREYFDGDGVEKDCARACAIFEMAYEKGSRSMKSGDYMMMGYYHQIDIEEGRQYGLMRNMPLAVKWYNEMAKMNRLGFGCLGSAYMEEEIRDYRKAYEYLLQAEDTDQRALYHLGMMYEFGLLGEVNLACAQLFFQRVLDVKEEGHYNHEYFYDQAVDRLADLRGENTVDFCPECFEYLRGRGWL